MFEENEVYTGGTAGVRVPNQQSPRGGGCEQQVVTKENIKKMEEGEEDKRKRYTALCLTAEPCPDVIFCMLEKMTDLTLHKGLAQEVHCYQREGDG